MKMLCHGKSANGSSSPVTPQDVTRLDAFAHLVDFLSTDKMTACLQASYRISRIVDAKPVLFWRDGDGDGEFVQFEGNATVIAELTAIFRFLNDPEELREALRQRFCSQTLPDRLWASTAFSQIGGLSYRAIVLKYMAGVNDPAVFMGTAALVSKVV